MRAGGCDVGPLGTLLRRLRILRQYVRIGLIRKSQFRTEFVSQVVMDTVWYATHILTFEVLYLYVPEIAGWSKPDVRVFLACLFVSDAFMMMWLGQGWHFGRELKDGKLDPVRVRPDSPILLYFFQRFSVEASVNMTIALSYGAFALWSSGLEPSWTTALVVPWAIALACWGRCILTIGFSIWEFWFVNSDLMHLMSQVLYAPADKPLDIWGLRLRQFFLYLLPVGLLSHVPAAMVLGKYGLLDGLEFSFWALVLGLAIFRLWRWSFHRYESSMS